ncbi:NACHT domain-containing protein [Glycomyces sp. L485]|uniref:NACHT domain-containing protein n=1 Tax=Glycomyces sp. L485 TaxID=2909235 RepID=UPI001F4AF6F0|nr:NACHT domain-containing protein [Glycomyces sp. L485]MCH7233003.1 NACHT domain-containing protein [Glycomyces sp. L485]
MTSSDAPKRRNRLRRLISGGLLTLGPSVLLVSVFWETLRERIPMSVPALSGSAVILIIVGFLALLGEEIGRRWAKLAAGRVDPYRWWWLARQRRAYIASLQDHAAEIELYGVATHGPYAMRLPEVHVATGLLRPGGATSPGRTGPSLLDQLEGPERRAFIVVGEPGAGKTTLLRHTALQICQNRSQLRRHLPVLIYLRDHVDAILDDPGGATIASLLERTPSLRHRAIHKGVRQRLEAGRCLVLLDGLDEMAGVEARQEVARWIKAQMTCYPKCDFVVTARRQGYDNTVLADLDTLRVQRFDHAQVEQFVRQWCYSVRCQETETTGRAVKAASDKDADRLLKLMGDSRELRELVSNPLLLIMVCNVDRYRGQLPASRAELYREMCEMLIHRRRQQSGARSHFDPLTARQKVAPLRELALRMMQGRTRRVGAAEAVAAFEERLRGAPKRVDPDDYLSQAVLNGILVDDGHDAYAFAHVTLQEYLAAAALRESGDDAFLAKRIDQVWWRETILLWAAEGEADAVVRACLQAGDVDSLLLAEECMDVAAELDPRLQHELRSFLDDRSGMDSADRALVDEWLLRRNTAESVPVGPEADLCVVPVRYAVWARFLTDLRFNDCLEPPGRLRDGEAAVGMWPVYVRMFLNWANHYAEAGHRYRLPVAEELNGYFAAVPAEAVGRPLWIESRPMPRLYCARGMTDTFTASRSAVADALRADRERTRGHRMLALAIHIAMQRKDADIGNPMQFRHSFGLARATDTDQSPGTILAESFQQLLVRIRTVSGFRGWHPSFEWDEHLERLGDNDFADSLVRQGLFPGDGARELLSVRAYLVLVSLWTRDAVMRPQSQPDAEERYLDAVGAAESDMAVYPDEVVPEIRDAAALLDASAADDAFAPLTGTAVELLRECERLLAPMLDRQARIDADQLASARIALNAAAAVAHRLLDDDEAVDRLRRAIAGLVLAEGRAAVDEESGPAGGGEFLLLVRERLGEPGEGERPTRPKSVVRRPGRLRRAVARIGGWWRGRGR